MNTFVLIVENIVLLSLMGIAFFFIATSRRLLGVFPSQILFGLCFGFTAAFVTLVPVELTDGATIDARAGPVLVSGIIAGPVGALIAATTGALARGFVGGNFAFSGMIVFFVYAAAGLALRRSGLVTEKTLASVRAIILAAIASMVGASLMFFLIRPIETAQRWFQYDLPYILIANVLSVSVVIVCIAVVASYIRKSDQLVELNEKLQLAKRAGGFGVWDYDIATETLKWDERSRELHGIDSRTFTGKFEDWEKTVHPDDLERAKNAFTTALEDKSVFECEYRVVLPDGRENRILGNAIVISDDDGNSARVVGSNIDLTEIRRTEDNLVDAQSLAVQALKVESVGQLTGGIAHDFNNMLAVVLGNLELLTLKQKSGELGGDEAQRLIASSIQAAKRGSDLTKNMLAYARKARLMPTTVNLNDTVEQTQRWISRTIESSVEINAELAPDVWSATVDESSLQSALVNLIVNARDALSGAGRITIRTANVVFDTSFVDHAGERLEAGAYVMLAVQDNGIGMDEDALARIFDPFYTTKPVGEGTGLGLSTVQGFVKQSRGAVRVESTPGVGTTFSLLFPATDHRHTIDAESVKDGAAKTVDADNVRRHILVVEDQPDVRDTLKHMLLAGGYRVSTASNGDEAFTLCQSASSFDLILSDVVMPGKLQGPELANALRSKYRSLPIVLITGYDRSDIASAPMATEEYVRLEKPIGQQDLLRVVREQLDRVDAVPQPT